MPSPTQADFFPDRLDGIPEVSLDDHGVPLVFRRHCARWEGTARRISREGQCIDTDRVRVEISIDGARYVQTNTVRIGSESERVSSYHGHFIEGKLVFPLTDEVYTLAGEKARAFSGVAWAVSDSLILYNGNRTLNGVATHYNEVITLISERERVRTTQLFENGIYRHVTMIDEEALLR
ncbi:hypothetical protein EVJ50_02470 [Synechococcus sp. RSCCF101]|uniref:hypothetical protein n=1 Tax=Synechococcus sp. RSCCF101 TaxID=2511069 RepID=UPI00124584DF|nr:hypothetical protein [Synechococcus sp. RSCCF101]QEY31277.1 hypothetical protein EVJ50_02470 [Synechococcus sp. RSCCF101]